MENIGKTSSKRHRARFAVHMDAFAWVKRDSYLPQGSQGLKAVTKEKLGYEPFEIDPEDMTPFAVEKVPRLFTPSPKFWLRTQYPMLWRRTTCT